MYVVMMLGHQFAGPFTDLPIARHVAKLLRSNNNYPVRVVCTETGHTVNEYE